MFVFYGRTDLNKTKNGVILRFDVPRAKLRYYYNPGKYLKVSTQAAQMSAVSRDQSHVIVVV